MIISPPGASPGSVSYYHSEKRYPQSIGLMILPHIYKRNDSIPHQVGQCCYNQSIDPPCCRIFLYVSQQQPTEKHCMQQHTIGNIFEGKLVTARDGISQG